jgi:DNA-binding transcriptional LysR family regulator
MPRIVMERSGEMEVFARVVQDGGFSAAARNLDLTPSAVSKLIARLEQRLGARLLTRTTRALRLTEEGEAYHRAALRVLQDLNEADLAVASGAVRGRLRISVSVPFGRRLVVPALPEFLARFPDTSVDLSLSDDIVDLLANQTDVAIRVGNLPDSALVARKLAQTPRILVASPAYLARMGTPENPADLPRHNCIGFNFRPSRVGWPFRDGPRVFEQLVTGNVLVNNGETARQVALDGLGIARLGRFHVAEDIAAGRLVPLLETFHGGDLELIHAIYVGGGEVPGRVRAFIAYMADVTARSGLFG